MGGMLRSLASTMLHETGQSDHPIAKKYEPLGGRQRYATTPSQGSVQSSVDGQKPRRKKTQTLFGGVTENQADVARKTLLGN